MARGVQPRRQGGPHRESGQDRAASGTPATGRPIGDPLLHQSLAIAVAFSPDGRTVLTGSRDNTARLWDAATGRPLGPPLRHDGEVTRVAFSPDGKTVLTGSYDSTVRIWDVTELPDEPERVAAWLATFTALDTLDFRMELSSASAILDYRSLGSCSPRSGLKRSDFVRWHFSDVTQCPTLVRSARNSRH